MVGTKMKKIRTTKITLPKKKTKRKKSRAKQRKEKTMKSQTHIFRKQMKEQKVKANWVLSTGYWVLGRPKRKATKQNNFLLFSLIQLTSLDCVADIIIIVIIIFVIINSIIIIFVIINSIIIILLLFY